MEVYYALLYIMETIKLGIPISLTGRYSVQATESFQGLSLFVSDVNEVGGLLIPSLGRKVPLELIHYDDESSVDKCKVLTEKLIVNDGVDMLIGPYSSSLALGATEVAEPYSKTLWNHGGATDEIERRGFTCVISSISPASSYLRGIINLIRNTDSEARKVALLSARDSGFSQNIAMGAEAEAQKLGFEAGDFKFKSGDEDLKGLLQEVKGFEPDVILGMGRAEDDISIAKEIKRQGLGANAIGLVVASIKLFRDTFGSFSEGFISVSQWERGLAIEPDIGPTPIEFSERYKGAYGKEPDYVAAQGYHIGLVIQHCILLSGTFDDVALRDTAKKTELKTFYGLFKTDSFGNQRGHKTVVVQWQGGRKVIVYPDVYSEAPLIYPL
jgi:branched-chain amino acid transport system substrate-binding protein